MTLTLTAAILLLGGAVALAVAAAASAAVAAGPAARVAPPGSDPPGPPELVARLDLLLAEVRADGRALREELEAARLAHQASRRVPREW